MAAARKKVEQKEKQRVDALSIYTVYRADCDNLTGDEQVRETWPTYPAAMIKNAYIHFK